MSYLKYQVIEHKVLHVSLLKQDMQKSRGLGRCVLGFFFNSLKSAFMKNDHVRYLILFHSSNSHAVHLTHTKKWKLLKLPPYSSPVPLGLRGEGGNPSFPRCDPRIAKAKLK